jgi:hypothetical protein
MCLFVSSVMYCTSYKLTLLLWRYFELVEVLGPHIALDTSLMAGQSCTVNFDFFSNLSVRESLSCRQAFDIFNRFLNSFMFVES